MASIYNWLFPAMWISWAGYWWVASRGAKPDERREPLASRMLHVVPLLVVFWLLAAKRAPVPLLGVRVFPWAPWQIWSAALVTFAGMAFSVWARVHLGGNWSGIVTVKRDHELICDGPYAIVRHPIYTGLLLAIVGSAMARGEWRGVVAIAIAVWTLWRKLGVEERWMAERFGQRYEAYRRRVPALVPFWR